jgi:Protein of unknown function (DUF3450)
MQKRREALPRKSQTLELFMKTPSLTFRHVVGLAYGAGLVVAVALAPLATPVFAQTVNPSGDEIVDIPRIKADMAKVKRDIQKAEADLRKTDSLSRDEAAVAQRNEERAQKDKERREKEIASLQARMLELRKQIDAERGKTARAANQAGEIDARRKNLAQHLAGWCDSVLVRVKSAPPFERESREERVRALKNDLLAGSASPEEGISRLAAILKDEVRAGDEVALLNRPLTLKDGETINAQVLKVGHQFAVFMDEDGKRMGYLERDGQGGWATREVTEFEDKLAVKKAIEVKAAKQPPQLVPLTVQVAPAQAAAAASQAEKTNAQTQGAR